MNDAAFYLSSLESERFAPVRRCNVVTPLRFRTGKECALIRVDPKVIGQDFDRPDDIDELIVAARHEGQTLFPISEFPLFVFIGLLRGTMAVDGSVDPDDVQVIGWGELYRSAEDAAAHKFG